MPATITAPPVYLNSHRGHDSTDAQYACVGFDVVRTHFLDGVLQVEVVQVVHGDGTSYLEALTAAKALRTGGYYGYPAERYACGCRWIGTMVGSPCTVVRDLTAGA